MTLQTYSVKYVAVVLGCMIAAFVSANVFGSTFANAQTATTTGRIIVDKITIPAGATTSFKFDARGSGYADFTLTDSTAPNEQSLATGTYRIIEEKVRGWKLTSSTCSLNGATSTNYSGGALSLIAGDTIRCMFTNTEATTTKATSTPKDRDHHKWPVWGVFKKIFGDSFFKNFWTAEVEAKWEAYLDQKHDKDKVKKEKERKDRKDRRD